MSLDVDECLAKPCRNGGTCTNNVGSYTCACAAGWQGHDCDKGRNYTNDVSIFMQEEYEYAVTY